MASITGNERLAKLLIDKGEHVNIDAKDDHLGTPLCMASAKGSKDIVEILLSSGADPNGVDPVIGTPLQSASYKGFVGIVELLLKHGADTNIVGGEYDTALRTASFRGHAEIVELLLSQKPGVKFRRKTFSPAGPHGFVLQRYGTWLARQLSHLTGHSETWPSELTRDTALHEATLAGQEKVIEVLLRWGAKSDADSDCHNATHSPAIEGCGESHNNVRLSCDRASHARLLYEAALCGHDETLERILCSHTEFHLQPDSYEMILQLALDQGRERVI